MSNPISQQLERKREANAKWQRANPEKRREYNRRWRAKQDIKAKERVYRATWRAKHPEKAAAIKLRYVTKNKDKIRRDKRVRQLKKKFGLTLEQFMSMFVGQSSACAICKSPSPRWRGDWHVDHCHDSGLVRGILCHGCNRMLHSRVTPEILRDAALYLEAAHDRG